MAEAARDIGEQPMLNAKPDGAQPAGPAVRRLALLGGESSGKTTLALALARALQTLWVPEYGRQLWEDLRQTLDPAQLLHVAERQVQLETEAEAAVHAQLQAADARGALRPPAGPWLVCDTTPLTTLQYCLHDHGQAPPALHALARRAYSLQVVCEPDFDFVQDGCRRDDSFRRQQHQWTLERLAEQGVQPLLVRGTVHQRVQLVLQRVLPRELQPSLQPSLQASPGLPAPGL